MTSIGVKYIGICSPCSTHSTFYAIDSVVKYRRYSNAIRMICVITLTGRVISNLKHSYLTLWLIIHSLIARYTRALNLIVTRSENYDQSAHRKRKHYIP